MKREFDHYTAGQFNYELKDMINLDKRFLYEGQKANMEIKVKNTQPKLKYSGPDLKITFDEGNSDLSSACFI